MGLFMTEKNPTIYKYTDNSGVRKILKNRTLRFAHTSELNDPFDVYIEDIYPVSTRWTGVALEIA